MRKVPYKPQGEKKFEIDSVLYISLKLLESKPIECGHASLHIACSSTRVGNVEQRCQDAEQIRFYLTSCSK